MAWKTLGLYAASPHGRRDVRDSLAFKWNECKAYSIDGRRNVGEVLHPGSIRFRTKSKSSPTVRKPMPEEVAIQLHQNKQE